MLRSVVVLSILSINVFASACSSTSEGPTPFKSKATSSSSSGTPAGDDDDDDAGRVIVPPVEDAGTKPPAEQASSFRGVLAATPSTRFGGVAPHCTYDATMKNIEVELAITPSGAVIGGTAKNSYVETIVGTCPFTALGTVAQAFTLSTAKGDELTLAGTGGPKTQLVLKLTKSGASWDAAASWERTDRTDDLKWVVKSNVTLGPK